MGSCGGRPRGSGKGYVVVLSDGSRETFSTSYEVGQRFSVSDTTVRTWIMNGYVSEVGQAQGIRGIYRK